MTIQHRRALPMQHREAAFCPATLNEGARTVELVWSTGAKVRRYDIWEDRHYEEELSLDAAHVRLDRLNGGAPLLKDHMHNLDSTIGVVERAWLKGGNGHALVRFSPRDDVAPILADVKAGILRNISVGYSVRKYKVIREDGALDVYRAVDWEPAELSIVAIPADPKAQVRSSEHAPITVECEFHISSKREYPTMSIAREINDLCKRHNAAHLAGDLIAAETSIEVAREKVLEHLAAEDEKTPTHPRLSNGDGAQQTRALADTFAARMGCNVDGPVEVRASVVDLAVRALEQSGIRVDARTNRAEIVTRALHSTGDFPIALGDAIGRVLAAAFDHAPAALKAVARAVELPDFRLRHVLAMSSAPSLEKVNEHGEFTHGTRAEEGPASYKLETYGRIFGITRQALVNDDLGAFADMARAFGQAASQREAAVLAALLLSNPAVADEVALFHADHGNILSTASSALSLTALASAVKALRLQTDVGGELLSLEPGAIVVPASLEMTARQLVAQITPVEHGKVNPFGNLAVVVEPRLDAASAKAWYLVSAGSSALEYAYMSGNAGVQVETRNGWEVDGLEVKARLDFGAAFVSHRGWIKNAGE